MHDIVAHNLAVIVALADAAALTAAAAPDAAGEKMWLVSGVGREALDEMRRLLARDDAPPLAPQPGLDDIDRLVEQVRAAGLPVVLTRSGVPGNWGPGAGLAVYRIAQEALTNTLKHAGPAAAASLRLAYTGDGVDLEITDDGVPRDASPSDDGRGLAGMRERAAAHGGQVDAGPLPGAGWRVHTRLRFNTVGAE
jgi:signal transduction histidine kinase